MATFCIIVGVIVLIVGGCTVCRLVREYSKKVSILRFRTWLSTEGVGHLSDAPSTRRFNAAEYCKDAEAERLLIYTEAEGMVILQELYQSILSSIEAAGSCTFSYLKSVFVDWLCLSDQKDIPNVDEKLTTLLEYARKMQQVFLVEINGEQAPLLNMDKGIYYGTSLLKEVENRLNAQGNLTALEYAETVVSGKDHFDKTMQVEVVQAILNQLCQNGKAVKSTDNYTELKYSTVYISNSLFKQLYGHRRNECPSC